MEERPAGPGPGDDTAVGPYEFASIEGVQYHYRRTGSGSALLLLHGIAASAYSYRDLVPRLEEGVETIAVDLLGFGFSERSSQYADYRVPVQAERLVRLLDRLGIDRFSICGHSFGSIVAAEMIRLVPERVERLVFVSPVTRFEPPPWYMRNGIALRLVCLLSWLLVKRPDKFEEVLGRAFHREGSLTREISEVYRRLLLREGFRDAFFGYAIAIAGRIEETSPFAHISRPVLVFGGKEDSIVTPESLEELAASLPQGAVEILPDCGHSAPEEYPDLVAERIRAFLSS